MAEEEKKKFIRKYNPIDGCYYLYDYQAADEQEEDKTPLRERLMELKVYTEGENEELTEWIDQQLLKLDKRAKIAKEKRAQTAASKDRLTQLIEYKLNTHWQTTDQITQSINYSDVTKPKVIYRLNCLQKQGRAQKIITRKDGKVVRLYAAPGVAKP